MSILRVSTKCGSSCGKVNLSALVEGIDLENGRYALSYHELVLVKTADFAGGYFTLGEARSIVEYRGEKVGGTYGYDVAVEATNVADFIALRREIARRLGCLVEDIDYPLEMRPPHEQSFVRGVSNDLRRFCKFVNARFASVRRQLGLKLFAH